MAMAQHLRQPRFNDDGVAIAQHGNVAQFGMELPGAIEANFAIGHNVANRLKTNCRQQSTPRIIWIVCGPTAGGEVVFAPDAGLVPITHKQPHALAGKRMEHGRGCVIEQPLKCHILFYPCRPSGPNGHLRRRQRGGCMFLDCSRWMNILHAIMDEMAVRAVSCIEISACWRSSPYARSRTNAGEAA